MSEAIPIYKAVAQEQATALIAFDEAVAAFRADPNSIREGCLETAIKRLRLWTAASREGHIVIVDGAGAERAPHPFELASWTKDLLFLRPLDQPDLYPFGRRTGIAGGTAFGLGWLIPAAHLVEVEAYINPATSGLHDATPPAPPVPESEPESTLSA
jgi:hypothetical protein